METINTRAYVLGDLVSSAGGFVGMFLGFGLFQLPEIFLSFIYITTASGCHLTFNITLQERLNIKITIVHYKRFSRV